MQSFIPYIIVLFAVNLAFCQVIASGSGPVHEQTTFGPDMCQVAGIPDFNISKVNTIPDYYQRDRSFGGFPGNGLTYCGPVAASNVLITLDRRSSLFVNDSADTRLRQYRMICSLGSSSYMGTGRDGVTAEGFCIGLQKYLDDYGIQARVSMDGYFDVEDRFRTGVTIPDMRKIKMHTFADKAVWLNIGWYKSRKNDEYEKTGAHWVTVVGYGYNRNKKTPDCLIIHDSDTKGGLNDYIVPEVIGTGILTDDLTSFPRDASGFRRFPIGKNKYGIICAAVYLEMIPPSAS